MVRESTSDRSRVQISAGFQSKLRFIPKISFNIGFNVSLNFHFYYQRRMEVNGTCNLGTHGTGIGTGILRRDENELEKIMQQKI